MRTASIVVALSSFWVCRAGAEEPVYFADPNLKVAVERDLHLWDPTATDMLGLTRLQGTWDGISDLTGLEYAANLQELWLDRNQISDLSPLSGLTNLKELILHKNQISDIGPLSGLASLERLDLSWNQIGDLSALSGLTHLRDLLLMSNQISDLSPLSGLHNLQELWLRENQITDISALSGLSDLRRLRLGYNRISDVSTLSGLTNLESLSLESNQISDISALVNLTGLSLLRLDQNGELNVEAYCRDLPKIAEKNPGVGLTYPPSRRSPAGVAASDGTYPDRVQVTWEAVCNGPEYTSYYQVSRARSAAGPGVPVSEWQTSLSFDDVTAEPAARYFYSVRTATSIQGSSAGDYSDPDVGSVWGVPVLTMSAAAGGWVTTPGAGAREVEIGRVIEVRAEPIDANLYFFAGWTGTAVEAGYVADAGAAATTVTVGGTCALRAHFLTWMDTIYVDDDGPGDPGPHTAAVSDPRESGTREHPVDTIQEGIDMALDGATIIVAEGTYRECAVFAGRQITVTGCDPNEPTVPRSYPVIDANYAGTAVSFSRGEDPNCVLSGFVMVRGKGDFAGGVRCEGSSPTIANCLIVGNRSVKPYGAAVYCVDSNAALVNCTVVDNVGGEPSAGIRLFDSNVALVNSIVWGNTRPEIRTGGVGNCSVAYSDVAGGWPGPGNVNADPLFAQPGRWADPNDPGASVEPNTPGVVWIDGDYHLRSQAGRWDPRTQAWVQDDTTSPCIDAGDPAGPVADEPVPNGGLINLGAYGGTAQASKSPVRP